MERFHIRVAGGDLTFSASHFITLSPDLCEPLHGHNYQAAAEIVGPLGPDALVADFVAVKRVLRGLLDELDHRVLLPQRHPAVRVAAGPQEVEVALGSRRWVFPTGDCALLPIENTTAEALARHLGQQLRQRLPEVAAATVVQVELTESSGFTAGWRWTAGGGPG